MRSTEKALEFLTRLRVTGVTLRVEKGQLRADAPDGTLSPEILEGISEHREDILEFFSAIGPRRVPAVLEPLPREGHVPLSFSQERLWLLDQLNPNGSEYNVPLAARINGPLDVEALRLSVTEIWRRHESLRTHFTSIDGEPAQVIEPASPVAFQQINLQSTPAARREEEAGRLIRYYAACAFSLSRGPLTRQVLLRLGPQEHLLLIVIHHAVFDGWSQGLFCRELSMLYSAYRAGLVSPLPEPAWQYQDYARWQRKRLTDSALAADLAYWRRKLAGLPPVLDLLTDRPRPVAQSPRGAEHSFSVSTATSEALARLARAHGSTLFMVLLSAAYALLYRWTGQRDIAIGTPVANRPTAETEGIIGFFVNTLVLRAALRGSATFIELLRDVRQTTLEAFARQDVPFEKVLEAVQPQRTLSHSPLFQVMCALQNTTPSVLDLEGLSLSPYAVPAELAKFELNIHMAETRSGIRGAVFYSADLFEPSTITRLVSGYVAVLDAVASAADTTLRDLPLGPGEKPDQVLPRSGPGSSRVPFVERTIIERFERIVESFGSKVAVSAGGAQWTYRALDRRANRIAQDILQRGERPGKIGLLFDHSPVMVAAVLGALKAGWTYVPLDPLNPRARLEAILSHSECALLAADRAYGALAADVGHGRAVIPADASQESDARPGADVEPAAPAYILYTSGSTGRPKGVVQNHCNVLHFMNVYARNLCITPQDRLAMFSSYCFDAAVMDIFGALLNGASLHLYDIRDHGFSGLTQWIREERISLYHSTPTVFRSAFEPLAGAEQFPSVRLVVLGGEAVFRRDFDLYRKHFSAQSCFVNGLGPTESTVTLQFFADRNTELMTNDVPVGRAVDGCEVDLLDESGEREVQGEIVVRGRHLALGYFKQPDLTSAVFREDPSGAGTRIYHTGDLGRLLPSGDIVFVGRKDAQLKIRGYRVEPGESESLLRRYPGVLAAAVTPRRDAAGETVLAAYVVLSPRGGARAGDLSRYLRDHLPDYLVPSRIVAVDQLPLLPNGKLDHGRLPPPGPAEARRETDYVAPRTPVEKEIADCWASALGVERVGVHDDFFELGGTSLSASRIIARLRESFDIALPLRALFMDPTVAGLARCLSWDAAARAYRYSAPAVRWDTVLPMQPRGDRRPFFIVAGAYAEEQSLRYLSSMIPHLGMDQPVYGLEHSAEDSAARGVVEMARDYVAEIRSLQAEGPYFLGGECIGGVVAFEMARQLAAEGQRVGLLVLLDTPAPSRLNAFRFRAGILLRRFGRLVSFALQLMRRNGAPESAELGREAARRARLLAPRSEEEKEASRIEAANRAFTRILYRYRPRRYSGKVVLLVNERDSRISRDLGWRRHASVETRTVPGNHITRLTIYGRDLASRVRDCLNEAQDAVRRESA